MADHSLETLLDLDGAILEVGEGYWVKFAARRVPSDEGRPHGIDYSLVLFSPNDDRLVAFDNAHPVQYGSGPSRKMAAQNDHVHRRDVTEPYRYKDAATLLEDFWREVERVLAEEGVS